METAIRDDVVGRSAEPTANGHGRRSRRSCRMQDRRLKAAAMFAGGARTAEVARTLGVTWRTAFRWRRALESGGVQALRSRGKPGPRPLLDSTQRRRLSFLLRSGATKYGFEDDDWTLSRVRALIERTFGVECSKVAVWRMMRRRTTRRSTRARIAP